MNMNSCKTCFHSSKLTREEPCNSCVCEEKWVSMDFLKDIPDNTPEEDEAFNALTNIVAHLMNKEALKAVEETWKDCDNCIHSLNPESLGPCGECKNVHLGKATKWEKIAASALDKQVSERHYKDFKIQPIKFIHANNIPFIEGVAIEHLCNWRDNEGIKDLEKAKHFIELLIKLEGKK